MVLPCWGGPLQRALGADQCAWEACGGRGLHRSGLSLLAGPWLWVLLGGSAPDVQTAFLLASLCRSPISPPARFGPMGREVTWEERTLPRPPGPLKAWAHVLLPRRRRAARDPWVGS